MLCSNAINMCYVDLRQTFRIIESRKLRFIVIMKDENEINENYENEIYRRVKILFNVLYRYFQDILRL